MTQFQEAKMLESIITTEAIVKVILYEIAKMKSKEETDSLDETFKKLLELAQKERMKILNSYQQN